MNIITIPADVETTELEIRCKTSWHGAGAMAVTIPFEVRDNFESGDKIILSKIGKQEPKYLIRIARVGTTKCGKLHIRIPSQIMHLFKHREVVTLTAPKSKSWGQE